MKKKKFQAQTLGRLIDLQSVYQSPLYQKSQNAPYNPDDLVRRFGGNATGLDKYDLMKTDDSVKAALFTKKAAVLSTGWKIAAASDDEGDKEIAAAIEKDLREKYEGTFDSALFEILSCTEYGFSVTEKVFDQDQDSIFIKQLKTQPPQSFEFYLDPFGNLLPDGLRQWGQAGKLTPLPLDKFIIYSHDPEFGNPYGTSDLRAAYRPWWSKDVVIKFQNIFLERFGNPLVIAKYDANLSKEEREILQDMINNISARTAFQMQKGTDIDIIQAQTSATDAFDKAISRYDMMIMRSILMPNLLGFGDTAGGSYALGKKQFDVLVWILEKIRREMGTLLTSRLIRQLVDLNFPGAVRYPKFVFNPITDEEDRTAKATTIITALTSGALSIDDATENYLRGLLGLPERSAKDQREQKAVVEDDEEEEEEKVFKFSRQPNRYEKKVDFAFIQKTLRDDALAGIDQIKEQLRKIRDDVTNQVIRKKVVEDKNVAAADKLELRYIRDMGLLIEGLVRGTYEAGVKSAKMTAKKADYSVSGIGLVKSKGVMWIKAQSKLLTGDIGTKLESAVKKIVLDGISRGAALNEVVNQIDTAFEPYLATPGVEGSEIAGMRLMTEVNTLYSQAFANGLREYNSGLEADGYIEAYEYSAILDDATTPGCEDLDGQIYGVANPYLNEIAPPRHWNCRALLVPIFKGEPWVEGPTMDVKREF